MGSKRKWTKMSKINSRKAQQMCFLHLQQDSCSAPGPNLEDSFHKERDEGCNATKRWKMMLVLEYVTWVEELAECLQEVSTKRIRRLENGTLPSQG